MSLNALLILRQSTGPQSLLLNINGSLTLFASNTGNIPKSFDTQNVPEINTCLGLTCGTWSIHDFIIRENETVGETDTAIVDQRCSESGKDDRVETNDGFDDFESNGKPKKGED
jgi:hypothetical protein